ncbi:MAG TPA: hypothetical protein VGO45_13700 [Bacteroidia bacterium]|jgi:hypothetical protein|nr:hypothetical protein [Bacteroidia bacterium]
MKPLKSTLRKTITLSVICCFLFTLKNNAQQVNPAGKSRKSLTVLNIDSKGLGLDPVQMGNLVRIELEKLDTFEVMDRYDVAYVVEKNKLNIGNCYGKLCLVEIGDQIHSDKMFTGSVDLYGETIIMTFRLIDVKTASIEKTQVNEYLNLPKDLQLMLKISIRQMFGMKTDESTIAYLSKKNSFENAVNNPNKERVNLSGPRSGCTLFTGNSAKYIQAPRNQGGYDSYPLMFQFGYQFEAQYLNEGNYQALFEFLPTVTGFNQNIFIPSLTIMNGFRNNKNGWELAFGPTFGLIPKADGYYDDGNVWHLANEYNSAVGPNPHQVQSRFDSRGNLELNAGFIVAFGKTIKSGKLNIPINGYVIPSKDGWRVGMSFGFNAKRR